MDTEEHQEMVFCQSHVNANLSLAEWQGEGIVSFCGEAIVLGRSFQVWVDLTVRVKIGIPYIDECFSSFS